MARRRPPRHVHAIGAEVVTPAGLGVVVAYVTAGAAEADAPQGGDDNPLHVVIVGKRKKDYRGDTLTLPPRRLTQAEITARVQHRAHQRAMLTCNVCGGRLSKRTGTCRNCEG